MKIRKATVADIPFIVSAILEIESRENSNTFNQLFGTTTEKSAAYLGLFLSDDENLGTEFSLNTYLIAEKEGQPVACCSLMHTDQNYYLSKSEMFPIHLQPETLSHFTETVKKLPHHREISENKFFIEYIFVAELFRRQGIAEALISEAETQIPEQFSYINVMSDNLAVINYYKKLGYNEYCKTEIDTPENKIYPSREKFILRKKLR